MDQNKFDILKHFIRFCKKELNIQSLPKISLIDDKSFVEQNRSLGAYDPNTPSIKVVSLNRNLADICRSLAHELTHHRQKELNMIGDGSGNTGSEIENEANAMAGIIMRDYGKLNLSVYDLDSI
jgi:Zn-dependent peptidase ImmA (M78 family)